MTHIVIYNFLLMINMFWQNLDTYINSPEHNVMNNVIQCTSIETSMVLVTHNTQIGHILIKVPSFSYHTIIYQFSTRGGFGGEIKILDDLYKMAGHKLKRDQLCVFP